MILPDEITNLLRTKSVTDILIPGYIDIDEQRNLKRFNSINDSVFIECEDQLLRCRVIEHSNNLELSVVDQVTSDFPWQEVGEFCISSIYEIVARFPEKNSITCVRAFLDDTCHIEKGIVRSIEFCLDDRGNIFIDPFNYFGIRVGTEQQRNEWLEDWGERFSFTEFVWNKS